MNPGSERSPKTLIFPAVSTLPNDPVDILDPEACPPAVVDENTLVTLSAHVLFKVVPPILSESESTCTELAVIIVPHSIRPNEPVDVMEPDTDPYLSINKYEPDTVSCPVKLCVSSVQSPKIVEPDAVDISIFETDEETTYWFAMRLPDIFRSPISFP